MKCDWCRENFKTTDNIALLDNKYMHDNKQDNEDCLFEYLLSKTNGICYMDYDEAIEDKKGYIEFLKSKVKRLEKEFR